MVVNLLRRSRPVQFSLERGSEEDKSLDDTVRPGMARTTEVVSQRHADRRTQYKYLYLTTQCSYQRLIARGGQRDQVSAYVLPTLLEESERSWIGAISAASR